MKKLFVTEIFLNRYMTGAKNIDLFLDVWYQIHFTLNNKVHS